MQKPNRINVIDLSFGLPGILLIFMVCLFSCSTGESGGTNIIFLHHSTGGVIWNGGVSSWIDNYNAENGTSYEITEFAYPDGVNYPWNNYPYDYWYLWVDNAGYQQVEGHDTLELITRTYDVIIFKHCFPVSNIQADTGSPSISSDVKSIENYQLQYNAIKAKLKEFPGKRFIVWTGAARIQSETTPEEAARAESFFNWVKNTWDEEGDNIYVWDFWALETEGGLYLRPEYATSDSHPNSTFAQSVAPCFGQRIVDVIEGRGDTGSITGN
jgi:hypothetical protein